MPDSQEQHQEKQRKQQEQEQKQQKKEEKKPSDVAGPLNNGKVVTLDQNNFKARVSEGVWYVVVFVVVVVVFVVFVVVDALILVPLPLLVLLVVVICRSYLITYSSYYKTLLLVNLAKVHFVVVVVICYFNYLLFCMMKQKYFKV